MRLFFVAVMAALALLGTGRAEAQQASDTVTFGNRLSVQTIVSALQSGGYQALLTPPNPATPSGNLGTITTGVGGIRVIILVQKCNNIPEEKVCSLIYLANFTDDKNLMTPEMALKLNGDASVSKLLPQKRPDGTSGFTIVYAYPCRDFEDTRFVNMVLSTFAADVVKIAGLYTAASR